MQAHRGISMENAKEQECKTMTNEEYRVKLGEIFDNIDENYKLRWLYNFIVAKIENSK